MSDQNRLRKVINILIRIIPPAPDLLKAEKRTFYVTYSLALVMTCSIIIHFISSLVFLGWEFKLAIEIGVFILLQGMMWLLRKGKSTIPRVVITLSVLGGTMANSIVDKFSIPILELSYLETRLVLITLIPIPFLLFSFKERGILWSTVSVIVLCTLSYDPIHNLFGVGYFQNNFTNPNYYFLNFVTALGLAVTGFVLLLYKWVAESAENRLAKQSELLSEASKKIQRQNKRLKEINTNLSVFVEDESFHLIRVKNEVIRRHTQMSRFSFTISHNIRSHTSRLIGLSRLLSIDEASDKKKIIKLIQESAEGVNQNLSILTEEIEHARETSLIEELQLECIWNEVKEMLLTTKFNLERIDVDFSKAPTLYTMKAPFISILYNISMLAFSSAEKREQIQILLSSNQREDASVRIIMRDYGVGHNFDKFPGNIFATPKYQDDADVRRSVVFYLIKLQVDSLEGSIKIWSKVNKGTLIVLQFPNTSA